ncbi:MAG TPA: hypothetical protein P5298_11285 [Spirochaetia bacterium]|nr:hypothetical protein [Spirochaetales bacterium]HRW24985.1 hypothetical protein [Spirochaetia bacterium]
MADGNNGSKRRFGRRGRGRGRSGAKGAEVPVEKDRAVAAERPEEQKSIFADQPPVVCGICGKQIFDLSSALAGRDGGQPVHFDCALASVSEGERLEPSERVAYIGRGSFAVVEYRDKSMTAFTVKRRLQWEKEGEKYDWRKSIQQRMGL